MPKKNRGGGYAKINVPKKKAEIFLEKSDRRYRDVFEKSQDAIMLLSDKGFFDCNPATLRMFGFKTVKEFCSRNPGQVSPPTQPDGTPSMKLANQRIGDAYKRGSNFFDWVHRRKNGEDFPATVLLTRFELEGKMVIQATVRDVTEQKKIADALVKSERRYHDVFESSQDALMLFDSKGFFDCNSATLKMFGYKTVKEFCGKHPGQLSPPAQPDGTPSMKLANKRIGDAYKKGSNFFDWVHRRKDGEDFPATVLLTRFELEGKMVIQATVRDVTDRKRLEDKLKRSYDELEIRVQERTADLQKSRDELAEEKARAEAYLSNIGEGIVAFDMKGRIILMNFAAEQILGKPIKEVLNKFFDKAFHLENSEGQWITPQDPLLAKAIRESKPTFSVFNYFNGNEAKIPLATTLSPILVKGKPLGIITTFRDIRQEEAFSRSKSEFIDLASHQLRTPLTGLKWILQEAQEMKSIDAWKKEYLKDGLTSIQRMITLVHNLLNVSRMESGSVAVNSESVNLGDFIAKLLKGEAQSFANEKKQQIHFAKPSQPIFAEIDKQLLQQIISNLVSNSIRYSSEKTTIELRLKKRGQMIDLTIQDHGIGIRQKDIKHLFDKFFRAEEASKYSTTGSGLGLYIVLQTLKVLHGEIRCESEFGKGSTFTVTLPQKAVIKKREGNVLFEHIIS
jgi:PAS domain S-box-containing protein